MAKNYCYKDSCKFVQTGFHLEQYMVCTTCKDEVTQSLCDRKKEEQEADRKRLERQKRRREEDEDEQKDLWQFL